MLVAAFALALTSTSVEPPTLLVYWYPGMQRSPRKEVHVAIWPSGRIIWREPEPTKVLRDGQWKVPEGQHFEGWVAPSVVRGMSARLRATGVFRLKSWGSVVVDGHHTSIVLKHGSERVLLASSGEPSKEPPWGTEPDEWRRGYEAWHQIRREWKSILPKQGQRRARPNVEEIVKSLSGR